LKKENHLLLVNDIVAYTVVVTGKVQGVFFRKHTKQKADELSIKGTVRNLPDGSVYLEIEGPHATITKMLDWCKQGPKSAVVADISSSLSEVQHFKHFKVEY
jgi:acylphosphatase